MTAEKRLLVVGEIPFDIVHTILNELLTADHDIASVAVSMAVADTGYGILPVFRRGERTTWPSRRYPDVPAIESGRGVGESTPETYPRSPAGGRDSSPIAGKAERSSPFNVVLDKARKRATKRPIPSPESRDGADPGSGGVAAFTKWFRPEIPAEESNRTAIRAPLPVAPHQRILVAEAGPISQARIQIAGGKLAGSQVHLSVVGGHIESLLLTSNETSRQTLVVAMDAVRERLRARGVAAAGAVSADVRGGPHRDTEAQAPAAATEGDRPSRQQSGGRRGTGGRECTGGRE